MSKWYNGREVTDAHPWKNKDSENYVGLRNQGSTCYLNALLQCLYHTPKFREKLSTNTNKHNETYLAVDYIFHKLDLKLGPETTNKLTESLRLSSYKQQDVPEIFQLLLNALDVDIAEGPCFKEVFWSTMVNLMQCLECRETDGYQTAMNITVLPLAVIPTLDKMQPWSVADALKQFQTTKNMTEENQIYCSKCKKKTDTTLMQTFTRLPPVLVVQLKRFEYIFLFNFFAKIDDEVLINRTLDVEFEVETQLKKKSYELFAICDHLGDFWGGHYTAIINPEGRQQWYLFNDSSVDTVNETSFAKCDRSRTAYLLMYREKSESNVDKSNSSLISQGQADKKDASTNDSHRCYYQENAYGDYWRGSWDKDLLDSRISETGCSVACIQNERERAATHQLSANTTSLELGKVTSQKRIISGRKEIVNHSKEIITTRSLKYQPKNTMNIQETSLIHPLISKQCNSKTKLYLSLKKADTIISKSKLHEKDVHGYSKTIQDLGEDNLTHSSNENAVLRYCQSIKKDFSWDCEHPLDFQQPICNLQVHGCYPKRELKEIIPTKTPMFVEAKLICDHDRCNKRKTSQVSKALNPEKYQCSGLKGTETLMKYLHIQDSHIQDLKQKVPQEESRRVPSLLSKRENPSSRSHQTIPANECKFNKNSNKQKIASNTKTSPGNKQGNGIKRHCAQAPGLNYLDTGSESLMRIRQNIRHHQAQKNAGPEKHDNNNRSQRAASINSSGSDSNAKKRLHTKDKKQSSTRPPWH